MASSYEAIVFCERQLVDPFRVASRVLLNKEYDAREVLQALNDRDS